MEKEIQMQKSFIEENEPIETIYFGGGTPSLLTEKELGKILAAIKNRFTISPVAEITLEANPDDISALNIDSWERSGINRLSLGIQSFKDEELSWMNRAHDSKQALLALKLIKASGINNYSVDLIYGSPLLNNEELKKNIDIVLEKDVPHISCYALTVEPRTILNTWIEMHKSAPVIPEIQATQYSLLDEWLREAGYDHYEISNFALPGMRSRHNSSYWKGKPYFGFGPSAHSYNGNNLRRWNISNNALYISQINHGIIPFEEELLGEKELINEFIMISLRTIEGISLKIFEQKFGKEAMDKLILSANKYIRSGNLELLNNQLVLTKKGKFLADGIAADLFVN